MTRTSLARLSTSAPIPLPPRSGGETTTTSTTDEAWMAPPPQESARPPAYDDIDASFALSPTMSLQAPADLVSAAMRQWAFALPALAPHLDFQSLTVASRRWRQLLWVHVHVQELSSASAWTHAATAAIDMQQLFRHVQHQAPRLSLALPESVEAQALTLEISDVLERLHRHWWDGQESTSRTDQRALASAPLAVRLAPTAMALSAMQYELAAGRLNLQRGRQQLLLIRAAAHHVFPSILDP